MKHAWLFLLCFPLTALGGKAEREYLKNEIEPVAKAAEEAFKTACGCDLKIHVRGGTFRAAGEMVHAKKICAAIKDNVAAFCTDDGGRKVMCKMASLDIVRGGDTKFSFSVKKGTVVTDGSSHPSWETILLELDK